MAVINKRDFPPLPSQKAGKRLRKNKSPDIARKSDFATLNDLPEELILDILDHLPGIDLGNFQLPTLLALSLTNKRLHRTLSDRIYVTYDSYFCEPYLFLRTMITKPDLARSVRNAHFRYGQEAHLDKVRYVPTAHDKKIVKQGMKMLDFPDWKVWATRCNTVNIELDILHTAILLHTPNLTELHIEDDFISNYPGAKWIELIKKTTIGSSFGRAHRFNHLEFVRVDANNMVLHQLAPLFHVPSLRRLLLRDLCEISLDGRTVPELQRVFPLLCSKIEELTLEDCFLCSDSLWTIFKAIAALKRFRYEVDPESELPGNMGSALAVLLTLHAKSLESLDIQVDSFGGEDEPRNSLYMYRSLKYLVALRHLKCPLSSIVDMRPGASTDLTEILPPSLTTLHITIRPYTRENKYMHALEQLADCNDLTLKDIHLEVLIPATRFAYDWERLVKPFSASGVDFVVHQDDDDDGFSDDWEDESTDSDSSDLSDSDSSDSSGEVDLYSSDD